MKKRILAAIAIFAVAFIGGYLLNEPKAEASVYSNNQRTYYYQTVVVKGKTIVIIENQSGTLMSTVALD